MDLHPWDFPGTNIYIYIYIFNEKARNTTQMKGQTRNTEVQVNEEEIGNYLKKHSE